MIKPALKYALFCGVFLVALFFVSLKFGSNPLLDLRHILFDLGVFFLFIFFAGKEYKDFLNNGYLHFWQGMSIGFIVFILGTFLFSLVLYVIFEQYPKLIDEYKEGARFFLESRKEFFLEEFSEEDFIDQLEAIDQVTTAQLMLNTFGKKLLVGFFITPVVSIILRKKPN